VDQTTLQCLPSASNPSTVAVQCPANFDYRIHAISIYKSVSGCPSTPSSDACWHSNITEEVNTTCPSGQSSCVLTLPAITSPLHCSTTMYTGDYFAVVDYHCQPGYSTYKNIFLSCLYFCTILDPETGPQSLPTLFFLLLLLFLLLVLRPFYFSADISAFVLHYRTVSDTKS